jgi:hypothetical protein
MSRLAGLGIGFSGNPILRAIVPDIVRLLLFQT